MDKPIIAVTGKNGQLGSELKELSALFPNFDFVFSDKEELDLTSASSLKNFFATHQPSFFVNCAAYTAVDKAEVDKDISYAINATAVGVIASLCNQYNTVLIQLSTDYVFNGMGKIPYEPDDVTDPVNHYGYTKLAGEQLALQNNLHTIVIRTSWVYSSYGHNFVKTMLRLMKERQEINVVNDQHGSPTYALDLAEAIMAIIRYCVQNPVQPGIFHYGNEGNISWYEFAAAIKEISGSSCHVHPIPSTQFPTPAKRPSYSVLDKQKIPSLYNIKLKDWRESLKICLEKMNSVNNQPS